MPAEVNRAETLDGVFNTVEWLMVQRDNREAEREAQQLQREATKAASAGRMPRPARLSFRGARGRG